MFYYSFWQFSGCGGEVLFFFKGRKLKHPRSQKECECRGGPRIHILWFLVPGSSCWRLGARILHQIPFLPDIIPCSAPDHTSRLPNFQGCCGYQRDNFYKCTFKTMKLCQCGPLKHCVTCKCPAFIKSYIHHRCLNVDHLLDIPK